jgi:hypothetical protein
MTGASILDPSGLAAAGGIGVLQTIKRGAIDPITPAGVVEAGELGRQSEYWFRCSTPSTPSVQGWRDRLPITPSF